jgi:hypothetical protein
VENYFFFFLGFFQTVSNNIIGGTWKALHIFVVKLANERVAKGQKHKMRELVRSRIISK